MDSGKSEQKQVPADRIPVWIKLVAGVPITLLLCLAIAILLIALAKAGHWVFFWILLVVEAYIVVAMGVLSWTQRQKQ